MSPWKAFPCFLSELAYIPQTALWAHWSRPRDNIEHWTQETIHPWEIQAPLTRLFMQGGPVSLVSVGEVGGGGESLGSEHHTLHTSTLY